MSAYLLNRKRKGGISTGNGRNDGDLICALNMMEKYGGEDGRRVIVPRDLHENYPLLSLRFFRSHAPNASQMTLVTRGDIGTEIGTGWRATS